MAKCLKPLRNSVLPRNPRDFLAPKNFSFWFLVLSSVASFSHIFSGTKPFFWGVLLGIYAQWGQYKLGKIWGLYMCGLSYEISFFLGLN